MKNSDMKISALLDQKRSIEGEISNIERALASLNGEMDHKANNFGEQGTVGIYSSSEYRFKATNEVMIEAASKMLSIYEGKLEPIVKKLDAIELMLSS